MLSIAMNKNFRFVSLVFVLVLFSFSQNLNAQTPRAMNAAEIELALKKLRVLGSALYVAAHPDDENTAMLAYLANERLARTAYLSLTRGDGGQNLIGTEKGDLLGVIRTQELLAARKLDGAEQFFTRAVDFGYSKSPEESFKLWGKEEVLADVVWVVRLYRPDVLIARFATDGSGGHGHHTASAILAEEAFKAAGDPNRFPEQLKYVQTWQPKRLMWNAYRVQDFKRDELLVVDLGTYNALLGQSYNEIAALSRSQHKSQGQGTPARRGSSLNGLKFVMGEPAMKDLFDGVNVTWTRIAGGEKVDALLNEALQKYNHSKPEEILPLLIRAHAEINKLPKDVWVEAKRKELLEVIKACAGLWLEATAEEQNATPGSTIKINLSSLNRSNAPLRLESVEFPFASGPVQANVDLRTNQPLPESLSSLSIQIPKEIGLSQPYWLQNNSKQTRATVTNQNLIGLSDNPPALSLKLKIRADDESLVFDVPVVYRRTDPVRGDVYSPFIIVPPAALNLEENVYVFPNLQAKTVRVKVKSNTKDLNGALQLKLPSGWTTKPEAIPVSLKDKNEEFVASFTVTPSLAASTENLQAEFLINNEHYRWGMWTISYEHIPRQTLFPEAKARLVRLNLIKGKESIGYVMGSGDEIPEALKQIGYDVTLLSDSDIDNTNLGTFDTIIVGIRAYNTRPRLRQQNQKLLDFVKAGGTLIVQYNTVDRNEPLNVGPYPFTISNERVTEEDARVSFVDTTHPVLNRPNKIAQEDFNDWVQERGTYFANAWDKQYQTVLASNDTGEKEKQGGLLYARYGKGVFIYTGYAFFRQLPAGVPGSYRLFVNLISAK
jgi:LmbE family N-acetylglucosaminyl deacetylase